MTVCEECGGFSRGRCYSNVSNISEIKGGSGILGVLGGVLELLKIVLRKKEYLTYFGKKRINKNSELE